MGLIVNQNINEGLSSWTTTILKIELLPNCVLFFSGGDFSWTNSRFTSYQLRLIRAVKRTITSLRHLGIVPQRVPKIADSTEPSFVH